MSHLQSFLAKRLQETFGVADTVYSKLSQHATAPSQSKKEKGLTRLNSM